MESTLFPCSSLRWRKLLAFICAAIFTLERCAFGQTPPAPPEPSAPDHAAAAPASPLFQRVVLLGASVTAGFDTTHPFGGPKTIQNRFSHFIESAIPGPHDPVATQANVLLFMKVREMMEKQIAATVAAKPTLVVGLDSLFWFCYGADMNPEQRVAKLDLGLHLLERIDAPLVVGDLPNASKAVGGILDKTEMPELATLAECNEKIKAWAAGRKNVVLFPLAEIMTQAQADDALSIGGLSWEKGKSRDLLQSDELHPSRRGLAALAIAALDAAAAANPPDPPGSLCRDLETVYAAAVARGDAALAPHGKPPPAVPAPAN
jgi:hypothetical protein